MFQSIDVVLDFVLMESIPLGNLTIDENHNMNDSNIEKERSKQICSVHVEPFHRQRRTDGTLSFSEQILTMQHIGRTNGRDGRYIKNDTSFDTDFDQGGIWKEIIYHGIGLKPIIGASL